MEVVADFAPSSDLPVSLQATRALIKKETMMVRMSNPWTLEQYIPMLNRSLMVSRNKVPDMNLRGLRRHAYSYPVLLLFMGQLFSVGMRYPHPINYEVF